MAAGSRRPASPSESEDAAAASLLALDLRGGSEAHGLMKGSVVPWSPSYDQGVSDRVPDRFVRLLAPIRGLLRASRFQAGAKSGGRWVMVAQAAMVRLSRALDLVPGQSPVTCRPVHPWRWSAARMRNRSDDP